MTPAVILRLSRKSGTALFASALLFTLSAGAHALGTPSNAQHAATQTSSVPDAYKLNMMIRTTLIALNHANRTGNYTVLRDLAAPVFHGTNNPARLAEIFAKLRARDLDLSPILFFQPKLRRPAEIDENGLLRLTGFFETRPERISFDLLFQPVQESWRLFGLAVDVAPPEVKATGAVGAGPRQQAARRSPAQDGVRESVAPRETTFVRQAASIPTPERRPLPPKTWRTQPLPAEVQSPSAGQGASEQARSSFWPF